MSNDYYETDWSLMDFTKPAPKAEESNAAVEPEKGVCTKCGRHVGRGLHVHMKSCNGHSDQAR